MKIFEECPEPGVLLNCKLPLAPPPRRPAAPRVPCAAGSASYEERGFIFDKDLRSWLLFKNLPLQGINLFSSFSSLAAVAFLCVWSARVGAEKRAQGGGAAQAIRLFIRAIVGAISRFACAATRLASPPYLLSP
ncbi:jg25435 [Pararge aegeria aegeria]|uniref:Jg25435 protein n=1 Tax=Pararge aegeria aegeria TaxID=348720 RepID=A0A8S4QUD4_9NEOP|nr:jg25435 [Pararge aegeria aegeria]